jgi:penicillin amidase
VFVSTLALAACGRTTPSAPPTPVPPQTSGTLQVQGLHAPVTVARDAWGVPHITASNDDDLFFAQGFVQAQDRLFQMDLWKRAAQGRLSEVLGANFIDRDAMTRRVQFRGDIDREWASYGPDTRAIAVAFTKGINAWVRRARAQPPEEFQLAGWAPEYWKPEDLLNRTDAFLASGSAVDDLFRARLVAAIGPVRTNEILPMPEGPTTAVDPGVDLSAITYLVPATLRRIGTAPFFLTLTGAASSAPRPSQRTIAPTSDGTGDDGAQDRELLLPAPEGMAWTVAGAKSATGAPLLAVQRVHAFDVPGGHYLVHLSSPGFEVAGATSPWLPGVLIGHNTRISWGMAAADADTQDVFVERLNPADPHQVERDGRWVDMTIDHERVDVKGRARPFEYDRQYTSNGVVIALDRERHLVYTLRWSGTEPGGAAGLSALAIDRARSWPEFQAAVARWNLPAEFVYADVEGRTDRVAAGRVPQRPPGTGMLVTAGWDSTRGWRGWEPAPIAGRSDRSVAGRVEAMLASSGTRTVDDLRTIQGDVRSVDAPPLLSVLASVRSVPRELDAVRARLTAWDGQMKPDSADARIYVRWEAAMRRLIAERLVPGEFAIDLARRIDIVDAVTRPRPPWFDAPGARDALLVQALAAAVDTGADNAGTTAARAVAGLVFQHPLAVFDAARRRFNVGPFPRRGYYDTVFATDRRSGPTFRAIFDVADWDRSVAIVAPGQSGSPSSPHYDDLAAAWANGEDVPLPFSAAAVQAATRDMLRLTP